MDQPTVSVVIPTYNRATLVARAVKSVVAQNYSNLEIIVVDDASDDNTGEVIQSIDDTRIEYVRHATNKHGSAARNTGIERANGKYVAFLDDDDEWYPNKVKKQVDLFERSQEKVGLVYCWADIYDEDGQVRTSKPTKSGDVFWASLTSNPIEATSTLMARMSTIDDVDGFDESLKRGQDSDLIRRIARRYRVDYVPEALVRRWIHEDERIQDESVENLHHSIDCRLKTLDEFSDELSKKPGYEAQICSNISRSYAKTGEKRECVKWYWKALRTAPLSPSVLREGIGIGNEIVQSYLDR